MVAMLVACSEREPVQPAASAASTAGEPTSGGAAASAASATVAKAAPPQPKPSLDLKAQAIPDAYSGDDPLAVVELLRDIQGKKGEFETAPQYNARLLGELKALKKDQGALDGVLAFAVPAHLVKMTYDADRQVLDVDITSRRFSGAHGVALYRTRQPREKYASIDTAYTSVHGRVVAHDDVTYVAVPAKEDTYDFYFRLTKVPPSRAAELKGNLRVMVVGKLSPPYLFGSRSSPEPYEDFMEHQEVMQLAGAAMWLYEYQSNTILSKNVIAESVWKVPRR
jgi:hypothetical protein